MKTIKNEIIRNIQLKNKMILVLLFLLSQIYPSSVFAQDKCGWFEENVKMKNNSEFLKNNMKCQRDIELFLKNNYLLRETEDITYEIPVVFHIVLKDPGTITDEMIFNQLNSLNEDYRAQNQDVISVPEPFQNLIADSKFHFFLANVNDPCNGITRTVYNGPCFNRLDNYVKHSNTGGIDAIDPSHILNIWICDLCGNTAGYTQPLGGPLETDGVVIGKDYISNEGRTLTHEIGHYFNLEHIWGNEAVNTCTDLDYVDDTPNQFGPNYGCPSFPRISCDNGPNGDLFMNFMDYVNDNCMHMFTHDQVDRMQACLLSSRTGLLQNYYQSQFFAATIEAILPSCQLNNGKLTAKGFGGVQPYIYSWSNGQNTKTISNLNPGFYSLTITDQNGCTSIASYTLEPEIIINSGESLWSKIVEFYNLGQFELQNTSLYVQNDLIFDIDYTFKNITFSFADNVKVTISEDVSVIIEDYAGKKSILKSCNNQWNGITIHEGGSLTVMNSKFYSGKFPITCLNNTQLTVASSLFEGFETAITLQGDVNIQTFNGNLFSNGNKGIVGKNCTFLDLKAEYSRNKFSDIDIGIWLSDCNADIQYNDFENVRIGIMPVLCFGSVIIKNNNVGYTQSGIVANITGGLHVEENVIGNINQYGDNGIKIISGKNAFVFDNEIFALKNGVLSFQNNTAILNNMVDVNGYYSDAVSFTGSNGYIADNLIFGTEAEAGINAFIGTDHLIENNEIYVMNSSSFTDAGMIKLQGPTECTVKENILNAGRFSDGLLLGNSGTNILECNDVTNALGISINVDYNSEFQEIKTNTMTGLTDLIIKSEIGVQRDKGNEFVGGTALALGMDDEELEGSYFFVNPTYDNHFPDNVQPEEGWFWNSSNAPEICKSPQGPGNINIYEDPVRLCEYFNRLKVLQTTNPKLFMVKLMHILNYLKKHKKPVPDCITIYVQRICGLDKISEVYVKLVGINKNDRENTLPLATIRENISADRIDAIKGSISDYKQYYQREYEGEMRLLDTLRTKLDSIRCPDTLIQVWKKVLLSYIDLISGDSMTTRTELTQIAKLCSYDYGEVVNLSRMMLSESDATNYNVYDNCREALIYRGKKPAIPQEVDIYPNPSEGNLTVDLPTRWESGTMEIYDISGMLLKKVFVEKKNKIDIQLNLNNGTYFIKLNSIDGKFSVKKFVVIK